MTSKLQITPRYISLNISILCLIFTISLSWMNHLSAQEINFCGVFPPHQALTQNLDSIIFDRFGNSYDLGSFHGTGGLRNDCGYFSLEFDGIPDSLKNIICEVFGDISEIIEQRINEAPCGESIVPSNVNIYIGYHPDVKYPALAAGTPFYSIEGSVSCEQMHLNRVYSKINGSKVFPGVSDAALYFNPSDTLSNSSDSLKWILI